MGRKILLVEDDRETAAYLAKGLAQEGHSVEQAANGQDGLFRAADHRLTVGDLEIDPLSRSVKRGGKKLDLKPREYLLLEYFARNEGRVVTRTMLLEQVWDYHFDPGTNVIDVHVSRLRRKLEDGFEKPLLHTVRGAGYMLAA